MSLGRIEVQAESDATSVRSVTKVRVPELDALRGIGSLAIVGWHLWPSAIFIGWTRVDLFFVISGYVITSVILRQREEQGFLRRFWLGRARRILPAYLMLIVPLLAAAALAGNPLTGDSLFYQLCFLQNLPRYWSGPVPRLLSPVNQTWSLAIEVQFYLIWPLTLMAFGRRSLWLLSPWLILCSLVARNSGLYPDVILSRCDGLAIGAFLALILGDGAMVPATGSRRVQVAAILAIGIVGVGYLTLGPTSMEDPQSRVAGCGPYGLAAVNLVYGSLVGLVIVWSGHPILAPVRCSPLLHIGRISYGIYLYHQAIILVARRLAGGEGVVVDCLAVAVTVALSWISWEYIERPIAGRGQCPAGVGRLGHRALLASAGVSLIALMAIVAGSGVVTPRILERAYRTRDGQEVQYALFVPASYRPGTLTPLILYLHGSGASSRDGGSPMDVGLGPAILRRSDEFPFFAVFPQARDRSWSADSGNAAVALEILDAVMREYPVDPSRVYLTGMSMGGNGTWGLAFTHPDRWAAIVPVCGWGEPATAASITSTPCWCFHGVEDPTVPVERSRAMVAALRAAGGAPRYTEYLGVGHDSWTRAYEDPELYVWLRQQHRPR
jgi:peptidoglycan/LPS O-acetylase OafA/YrhL/predicted esterase